MQRRVIFFSQDDGDKCPVCDKNYHANSKKCSDCGAPNPRKEDRAEKPKETAENTAPVTGTAEMAAYVTGKESEAAGGTSLAPGVVAT